MIINFNIGLLGHVDSGKTTIAKVLSEISSTAAFDKSPQSQERGITLDLGFSATVIDTPNHLKSTTPAEQIQLTFVDCPGHASLIRTIIGGAQIIDLMILVVDAQKGIQTQTAECILIGEILRKKLITVVNKIDMIEETKRANYLDKMRVRLKRTFATTEFQDVPIFCISALSQLNIVEFLEGIKEHIFIPTRDSQLPFFMYVDHCFPIKGQGTVCTGTIVQGKLSVNDTIELPFIKEQRKVKSIQMFKQPVQSAVMGDRVGVCVTQFNAKQMERGVIAQPGYLSRICAAIVRLNRIEYYKFPLRSKSKLHVTIGHETVMANITFFKHADTAVTFDFVSEYEYVGKIPVDEKLTNEHFVLLEFEKSILATSNSILIASKLDLDVHASSCRLAFWGSIEWLTHSPQYINDVLPKLRIYKNKLKQGTVQRVADNEHIIVQNLFKKESNREMYLGKRVELSTGESGVIESTFGQTSKVKIHFPNGLQTETLELLNTKANGVVVLLKFKKYVFNKSLGLVQ